MKALPESPRKQILRRLCLTDLFFLLAFVLRREDVRRALLVPRRARFLQARCIEVQEDPDNHLDLWAREHYKLQRLDEPTPTPKGWVLHGDLVPGDKVFGADGRICRVVALNPIVHDSECYEIEFDDGTVIQAGAEHLWEVERKTRKRAPKSYNKPLPKRIYREAVLMQTRQIAQHLHRPDGRLAIRVAAPLLLPKKNLPVHPYVLGAWLGDGTSENGGITCGDPDLFMHIESCGHALGANKTPARNSQYRNILGLSKNLHDLGVRGKEKKSIPAIYLRASIEQRLALLQGLMDTDGSCDTRGTATFCNTNKILVDGVVELANTLGLKPRLRRHIGEYKGEPYPFWHVSFQAYKDFPVFRLTRKLKRCKDGERKNPRRFIVSCKKKPSVPMRCIQVDSADGLYLTGKSMLPTHNSTIITFAKTIQDILENPEITACIFSHTRPNAKKFLVQIKTEFQSNTLLKWIFDDVLWADPEVEAPKWSEDEGIIVKRKGNPKEPTLCAFGLVDGMPTGAHFMLRVYDDTVTRESVTTPEQIKKTTEAWELSDNLGAEGGTQRYIGTRYSLHDTYAEIISRGIAVRKYPATHNGQINGNPVLFTEAYWSHKKKTQSRRTLAAQMMQNPLADSDATFQSVWLLAYEVRPRIMNVMIICDPSKGKNRKNDNTAIIVLGISISGACYLLDGYCHRMGLSQRWTCLRELYLKWSRMPGVQLVRVGYERYGAQTDDEYFDERMMEEARKPRHEQAIFEIRELNWVNEGTRGEQGKTDRVERLEPDFRNGRFFLPRAVWRDGKPMTWTVDMDPDSNTYLTVVYQDFRGFTKKQQQMVDGGSPELIAKAIKRIDNEKHIYDLTLQLIAEYLFFPFGGKDDLIDVASRKYDMDMLPPVASLSAGTDPNVYHDS